MTLEQLRQRWPVREWSVAGQAVGVVRTEGEGVPALWLPGAQGTAEIFFKQILAWGGQRTLVSLGYPPWTGGAELADFVVRLADALALPRFDLVGTSLGGWIGQWVAARHPDRVHRLVIGNSFLDPAPAQAPDKLQALQQRSAELVKAEVLARIEAQPDSELKAVQLELMGRGQSAESLRARMLAVQLATPAPPLGLPDERVLIVECDNDPLIPAPMRATMRAGHPQARVAVVEGGGHYPYLLRPEAYNAAVGGFLGL